MNTVGASLHTKVHNWINTVGFSLNASETDCKRNITTKHYFFETFNFLEESKDGAPEKARFLCFDTYGEKIKVKSLLDLQAAFFENISQLK